MTKRRLFVFLASTVAVVGVSALVTPVVVVRAQSSAFLIKYVQTSKGLPATELFYARRGDGSVVEWRARPAPDGKQYDQRTIYDIPKGAKVVLEGATESISTYPLSQRELSELQKPSLNCGPDGSDPAESVFLGYRVVMKTLRLSTPDNRRIESWFAPDLVCAVLRQTTFYHDPDGVERQLATKEAATITGGEPDPTLFVIPQWTERSPSEVMVEFAKKFQEPLPPNGQLFDQAFRTAIAVPDDHNGIIRPDGLCWSDFI